MRKSRLFLLLSLLPFFTQAQDYPPSGLAGPELRDWLLSNWFDPFYGVASFTNSRFEANTFRDRYRTARFEMYNYIDNDNNIITCVYGGYEHTYSSSQNTNPQPINAEHTIPRSFYNSTDPMFSDVHHLYPTFETWNTVRSNNPFDEIDDNVTTRWMRLNTDRSSIPTSNIDEYSEFASGRFEPREDHKGNVARAVFYFYTMYEDEPALDRSISEVGDPAMLYQWHLDDPVDADEAARNNAIASFQGNRNPYVDHPELVCLAFGFSNCPSGGGNDDPPVPPTNLTAVAGESSIGVSWTDANNSTASYVVERSFEDDDRWFERERLSPGSTSYTDLTLSLGTLYRYRVYATKGGQVSAFTDEVSVRFGEPVSLTGTPSSYRLYPNPANGSVTIDGGDLLKAVLYDLNGRELLTLEAGSNRLAHIAAGVYIVKIWPEQGPAESIRLILR